MGYVSVAFCDMCGKRTSELPGKLILSREFKKNYSIRQVWAKRCCNRCLKKLSSTETVGDKIKEDFELKLDKLRANTQKQMLLLDNKEVM